MKTVAGLLVVSLFLMLGPACSDDDDNTQDGSVVVDITTQDVAVTDGPGPGGDLPPGSESKPVGDGPPATDGNDPLPPDLTAWCVGTTAKFRIGSQDQANWTGMDAPGQVTGKVMTIEPQFKVGGVKHSFYLTILYTKTNISPVKVDLATLKAGESVKKNGPTGPVVPAAKLKGIVEIVAAGGGHQLQVCAWVDGVSYYFPNMPMG